MEATPQPHRHLGHAILDLLICPLLQLSPRILYSSLAALLTRTPWTHRATAAVLTTLFALAEYQHPGYLPTAHQLAVGATSLLSSAAAAAALLALDDWLEDAVWPWHQPGWVWPWERWLWACAVGSEDPSEPSFLSQTTPCARAHAAGAQVRAAPGAPDDALVIPPTPLLPRGMRSGMRVMADTPPVVHRSGLLGESPLSRPASGGNVDGTLLVGLGATWMAGEECVGMGVMEVEMGEALCAVAMREAGGNDEGGDGGE